MPSPPTSLQSVQSAQLTMLLGRPCPQGCRGLSDPPSTPSTCAPPPLPARQPPQAGRTLGGPSPILTPAGRAQRLSASLHAPPLPRCLQVAPQASSTGVSLKCLCTVVWRGVRLFFDGLGVWGRSPQPPEGHRCRQASKTHFLTYFGQIFAHRRPSLSPTFSAEKLRRLVDDRVVDGGFQTPCPLPASVRPASPVQRG